MTIEIHELIIEARVTDSADAGPQQNLHGESLFNHEQQLIERITRQVLRQVVAQLREESWGMR